MIAIDAYRTKAGVWFCCQLKHLATQTASRIESALVLARPHRLLIRQIWPGNILGSEADGMLCLDGDGWARGANPIIARQMVPGMGPQPLAHASDLFGQAPMATPNCSTYGHPNCPRQDG